MVGLIVGLLKALILKPLNATYLLRTCGFGAGIRKAFLRIGTVDVEKRCAFILL